MHCPTLAELPPPPPGKTGWPWTEESSTFPADQPDGAPWPKIGIVTPSFNQADYLEQSIRSVLLQGYPNLDYVIIDGGSTDQSVAVIRKYERWITFWVSERDQGCSDACAKGFTHTNGDLLGVMNGDDFFAPDAFAKLLTLRQTHPDHVFWGGTSVELDLAGNQIKAKQPYVRDQNAVGNWGVGMWCFGVGILFDGPAYRDVGGFDPRFRVACDVELWIRLAKKGKFTFTSETTAFVHHNPQSVSRINEMRNDMELVAANFLHGHPDIARIKMIRYFKIWLQSLKANPSPEPDSAEAILSLAPPGILVRALLRRLASNVKQGLRGLFRR